MSLMAGNQSSSFVRGISMELSPHRADSAITASSIWFALFIILASATAGVIGPLLKKAW